MFRIAAGLGTCLVAVVIVGCGTAPAANQATPSARSASGCQGPGPTTQTVVITVADNAKTHCVRVGDKLRVDLSGIGSSTWQPPLVTGNALISTGGPTTTQGVTSASYTAVAPGRAVVTSVRPPCRFAVSSAKNELEPAYRLPKVQSQRLCTSGHRFSTLVIVQG